MLNTLNYARIIIPCKVKLNYRVIHKHWQKKFSCDWSTLEIALPKQLGVHKLDLELKEIAEYIDWSPLFWAWGFKGMYPKILDHPQTGRECLKILQDAKKNARHDYSR